MTRIRLAKFSTMNWAHKLDPGPRNSGDVLVAQSTFKSAADPLVQKNTRITYTTASHFPVPDTPKPLPKKLTLTKNQTQVDVIFHATFRSSKAGMTSSILLQPRKPSSSKALLPETQVSRRHSKNSFPACHSYLAMQHFPSLSTCAATVLCTLLASPLAS